MTTDLILGTAGHIDHGKTALVAALSGTDTDRLPEEKRRGITIELGFAELDLGEFRLGIVDVPGHERFVRQMLAGATGMDVAMLVVAADDSVKPQTREHLEVLRLLDLPAGVIALTKCDLADPEWLVLVAAEVRELVAGTFLEHAPMVQTSAVTGAGLDELKTALTQAAGQAARMRPSHEHAPFRMAIDRAFTIAGHGTVVTGSVSSGKASVGEQLVIQPGEHEVRVRGLQTHDRTVPSVHRGQRAAINLAGVHHGQVERGHELASPGHLAPSRLMTVRLNLLPSAPRRLKNRARLRVHLGTAEALTAVSLMGREYLEPGDSGYAQLFLREPVVSVWHQPFVLRSESPVETIGGGRVLVPDAEKLRRPDETVMTELRELSADDPRRRSSAALFFARPGTWTATDLARTAGIIETQPMEAALRDCGDLLEITVSPTRTVRLHRLAAERWVARIEQVLQRLHADQPLRKWLDRSQLAKRFAYVRDPALITALLQYMAAEGLIRVNDKQVALVSHQPSLSAAEQETYAALMQRFVDAGFQPPTLSECQQADKKNEHRIRQLISLAVAEGELIHIGGELFLHRDAQQRLQELLTSEMPQHDGMTVSDIRNLLDTTRKFAVPICEYLDRVGFTRRAGDRRYLIRVAP